MTPETQFLTRATIEPSADPFAALLGELAATRPDVYEHAQRVALLAGAVARALPAVDTSVLDVERAALAHDIGKLAIPRSILNKPAALTPAERQLMQAHPAIGDELLRAIPDARDLAGLARAHHERFDGRGYPDGLRGHHVPLGAQIISVCDSWDAMTWSRPYRDALSFDEAAVELVAHAGTQWRPDLVRLTLEVASEARGSRVTAAVAKPGIDVMRQLVAVK